VRTQTEYMTNSFRVVTDVQASCPEAEAFKQAVLNGFTRTPKTLPSDFIYDAIGSELFNRIMELPEYYPARCETEILQTHGAELQQYLPDTRFNLVDLGAGDGSKSQLLLQRFVNAGLDFRYVPVDVSHAAVTGLCDRLRRELPDLEVEGLVGDYTQALLSLREEDASFPTLALFLGTSVGNMMPEDSRALLCDLRASMGHNDLLLIGADLKKEPRILQPAYADSQGLTAEFNLNLLARANRDLDGEFDLDKWEFFSTWDPVEGAMQSFLLSREDQSVRIGALRRSFHFSEWEPIHTESSYKFSAEDLGEIAGLAGFKVERMWLDADRLFSSSLWRTTHV
jgi:L-histidine N-alpha-methyltransferase